MLSPFFAVTPPAPDAPEEPIFESIVTTEDLSREAQSAWKRLSDLTPEEMMINGAWTLGIIIGAIILLAIFRWLLRFVARLLSPKEDKHDVNAKRARGTVGGWTMLIARFVVGVVAIAWIFHVWGFDVRGGPVGAILKAFWRVGWIVMIAIALIEVTGFALSRGLVRVAGRAQDLRRAGQIKTIAPILKGVVHTVIALIATMMVLSQVGVEIGPLIAGAGIVGIAVGFGAQTLVKDFLTGLFLVIEDIVSVGDVVEINGFGGTVEAMTLRTIRLRDADGTVHIFPYGEAQAIHNRTHIYAYALVDLQISYMSDIERAIAAIKEAGDSLRQDEDYGAHLLSNADVLGVDQINDNAVVVRARIKTQAGEQWRVKREFLKRAKIALDDAGILFSHRHQAVPPFEEIRDRAKP